jgi:hypothetical protein
MEWTHIFKVFPCNKLIWINLLPFKIKKIFKITTTEEWNTMITEIIITTPLEKEPIQACILKADLEAEAWKETEKEYK